jgi:hypothetical protein
MRKFIAILMIIPTLTMAQSLNLNTQHPYMYSDYCEEDNTMSFYLCESGTCGVLGPQANIPYHLIEKLRKDEGLDRTETIVADVGAAVVIFLGAWMVGGYVVGGAYMLLGMFTTQGIAIGAGGGGALTYVTTTVFDPLNPVHQFKEFNVLRDVINGDDRKPQDIYQDAERLHQVLMKLKTKKRYLKLW